MLEDADRERARVAEARDESASEMTEGSPDFAAGLDWDDDADVDEASELVDIISRLDKRREATRGVGTENPSAVADNGRLDQDELGVATGPALSARVSPDTVPLRVRRAR